MDFYWHYSGKETVDAHGKENFCRAINVAKQVFNTLTEYIQVGSAQRLLFILGISIRLSLFFSF
jgi:hypothetical protein